MQKNMKVSIDTKEDSHEEIKKVIRMLQNLVGDSEEIFTNQPAESSAQPAENAFTNIFGDTSNTSQETPNSEQTTEETEKPQAEEAAQSTEDLFAELFNEEEIKKINQAQVKEEEAEEELPKKKDKRYSIEFYD